MNAMILAAGKGTRLRPLTETLPKPMVPVAGKPLLEHTILWLHRHGIRRVAINVHYGADLVRAALGNGSRLGVEICYSQEEELLGTAGGVKRMEAFFEDPFVVVYGDVLTDIDLTALVAFHRGHPAGARATLTLDQRPDAAQCGVVEMTDACRITRFVEKPAPGDIRSPWVNSGIMVVDRPLLGSIPAGRFCDFGRDVLPAWLRDGVPLYGWGVPAGGYLIDIGTPEKYAQANRDWAERMKRQDGP